MEIVSRSFSDPKNHHKGWFRVFRFARGIEVWMGSRYFDIFF